MDIIIFTCLSGIFFQRSIGAYQLAHFLREHGYTVQVIDFTDHFTDEELLETTKKFVTEDTLAIGISTSFYTVNDVKTKFIHNDNNKYEFLELPENILTVVDNLKNRYPKLKLIIGGSKSESAKNIPIVDVVIHGYAEDKMLDYLNSIPHNKKKIKSKNIIMSTSYSSPKIIKDDPICKKFSIENLQHRFNYQDCILPKETLPLEVSRGCIFKCSFCAFPLNGKSKLDYLRDPEFIKDELIYNYENFGTTNYFLSDDTFNDSTEKIEKIHKSITSLPFKISFVTYLRLDLLNAHKEQIPLLKEMGLASTFFGIESLNQKSVSTIGKGMNVNRAKEFLLELHYEHWKESIPITCSFIIGLPYETKDSINSTYQWIRNTPINSIFFPLSLNNKSYYKSEFDSNYEKYGYKLDLETGYWENENFNFNEAVKIAEMYNEELMRKENVPSSWFLMTLLNHGYTLEEAIKIKIKDLSYIRIFKNRERRIKEYKSKLLSINIDNSKGFHYDRI
jgi:radical SAM superfamily enzyme YgiQ (UPF0313 family)